MKQERPLAFFTGISVVLAWASLYAGVPVVMEFLHTGLVPRLPSAVLAAALMLSAVVAFFSGLVLDTITHSRREMKRLAYLRYPPVSAAADLVAVEPARRRAGRMRRETTNRIRFAIEELLPPIVRDSILFRGAARAVWGGHIDALADFRTRAPFLAASEYEALYRAHPRVHEDTDNSSACLDLVTSYVTGDTLCDVGCGTGHLLRHVRERAGHRFRRLVGVNFVLPAAAADPDIEFREAMIEALPFPDRAFDTVVCTHVIEHILDYRAAIAELRRVTRRRLLIVVPREREIDLCLQSPLQFLSLPAQLPARHDPGAAAQSLSRCGARHLLHGRPRTGAMKPGHLVILALVPLVIAVGQILFKLVSTGQPEVRGVSGALIYFADWRLWLALLLYGSATLAWLAAIRKIPINQAYMFMALSYVYLPVISWAVARRALQLRAGRGAGADPHRPLFLDDRARRRLSTFRKSVHTFPIRTSPALNMAQFLIGEVI